MQNTMPGIRQAVVGTCSAARAKRHSASADASSAARPCSAATGISGGTVPSSP